jgi:EthD domain
MSEFKAYYEDRHVPLIDRLLPTPQDYRRNYAIEGRTYESAHAADGRIDERAFDVMTEITYASEEAFQQMMEALADPGVGALIATDEERFLERATMRTFFVEEVR